MNASDILKYGHQKVLQTLDGLPDRDRETTDVCGVGSVKDIVATPEFFLSLSWLKFSPDSLMVAPHLLLTNSTYPEIVAG